MSKYTQDQPTESMLAERASFRAHVESALAERQKAHPSEFTQPIDEAKKTDWINSTADFKVVMAESAIPKDVNDELNAATKRFGEADFSREALAAFVAEYRVLLKDYPMALGVMDETYGKDEGKWDRMHELSVQKKKDGYEGLFDYKLIEKNWKEMEEAKKIGMES